MQYFRGWMTPEPSEEPERKWERLNALPKRALAWLALGPAWPSEVAEGGFPLDPANTWTGPPVTQKLQMEADRGFLTALPATTPWEGPIFSLPASTRRSAQELFALDPRYGTEFLQRELALSGQAMQKSGGSLLEYDPLLSRWARLASLAGNDAALAEEFDRQVSAAFQAADWAAQLSIPEASRWIDAAQQIADVVGGPLLISVGRARNRLELYSRRANDKRKLANYLPRPEQDAAVDELLRDEDHWALHFAGEGGVGKTMLLRHVTEKPGLAVSRVDFDYLNPDYPRRAPGLLLVALAEDFRLQAGPDMESAFERFDRRVNSLHSQIEGALRVGQNEPMSLDTEPLEDVLQAFVDALGKLAENRQPVLLLDTCEELAKIRPDGSIPDNVAGTFEILNRLHERYKRVRVIFAGRRPLASTGYGWNAESPLGPQPHLRLHLIEHFTRQQADDYLSAFHEEMDGRTVSVPKDHIPVLRSLSVTSSAGARQRFSIPGQPPMDEERYNAYDLEMYADWVCRDPNLTPEKLTAAGRHYYIRERIVGRAGKVRPLVPILAVCGRFDVGILKMFVIQSLGEDTATGSTLEQRIRAVTDLDWIQPDRAAGPDMWRVDNPLREQLLRYYESQEAADYHAARRTVADILKQETLSRPFLQLNEQYFEVALDTLLDEPREAAAWWAQIEDRIAMDGQWVWASRLISLLLAHPVLAPDRPMSLRAAVVATRAAALLHTGEADPLSIWPDVEMALDRYPEVPQRRRIELRARLAMGRVTPSVSGLDARNDPQLVAACLAQVEAAVERGDGTLDGEMTRSLDELSVTVTDPGMRAFVRSLEARCVRIPRDRNETRVIWKEALGGASVGIANTWLDWRPPDDLACRIALEFIRAGYATAEDISLDPSSKTVDADRLASAVLLHFQMASETRAGDLEVARQKPRCTAHRYYPPYFVAALWKSARDAAPGDAVAELGKLSSSFAGLADVALAIDRVHLDIRLRYRMATGAVPPAVKNSKAESDRLLTAIYTRLFLDGSTRPEGSAGRIANDRWYPAAELAMREAEVKLILEGSGAASALEAAEQCRTAGDALGQMLGLVTEAVWAASAKDRPRLASALEKLRSCYKLQLAGLEPPRLPRWPELEEAVRASKASEVLDSVPKDWRPAAVRTAAALHYHVNGDADASDLLTWVRRNYSVTTLGGQQLPAELDFLTQPAGGIRKWIHTAGKVLGAVIAVAVVMGGTNLIYRGFVAGLHKVGVNLDTIPNILLLAGAVIALASLPAMLGGLSSLYIRLCEFRVEIVPAEAPANRNRPLDVVYTVRNSTKFLRFYLFRNHRQLQPTTEERYAWLNEQMSVKKPQTNYRLLKRLLFGAMADIEIGVDESTAAAPWEAIVHLPSHESALADSPFRTRRALQMREGRTAQVPAAGRLKVAVWSWAPETQVASRKIIELLRTGGSKLEVVIPPFPNATAPDTDILVIYGNPGEGTAAPGLELENVKRTTQFQATQAYSTDSTANAAPAGLHTTTSITSRCPNLRICIVQPPPSSISRRVSSDRRDAGLMRRIGAELFRTGIPAVLMLPSAVEQTPAEILGKLRPVLRGDLGPRNTARTIVAAVSDLQRALATLNLPDTEAALEIALDVCLYIEKRVDLRVNTNGTRPVAV